MRIATFNILSGRSPTEDRVDTARFAEAVRTLDADVLCLQEVDRNQPRSAHADLTAIAAEAMDASDHRFVAAVAGTPGATWVAATGEEQPDAAAYGIALLSRHRVSGWQVVRLPSAPTRAPLLFPGRRWPVWVRDEPRVALVADVEAPGRRLRVATTHLTFLPLWNALQLRLLTRSLGGQRYAAGPTVLTGDLNMGPQQSSRLTGMRPLASGFTFPVDEPARQLDHILTDDPALVVSGQQVVRLGISDHRALVADLG